MSTEPQPADDMHGVFRPSPWGPLLGYGAEHIQWRPASSPPPAPAPAAPVETDATQTTEFGSLVASIFEQQQDEEATTTTEPVDQPKTIWPPMQMATTTTDSTSTMTESVELTETTEAAQDVTPTATSTSDADSVTEEVPTRTVCSHPRTARSMQHSLLNVVLHCIVAFTINLSSEQHPKGSISSVRAANTHIRARF
jgi:hypothetical protein